MIRSTGLDGVDLVALIRRAGNSFGSLNAVNDGVNALTYRELVSRAERTANALDLMSIPPGAPIGILSENRTEFVEVDLGIALARRVRVALNGRLKLNDHLYVAKDSGMKMLVHSGSFAEEAAALAGELGIVCVSLDVAAPGTSYEALIKDVPDTPIDRRTDPDVPAWITYTSGTTGEPKGVVLPTRSVREVALNLLLELGPVWPGDRVVLPQPLSHGAGYFVLPWLMSGGELYVIRQFDPEAVWRAAKSVEGRSTMLKCVPAMIPSILDTIPKRGSGYDTVVYGAAPMPQPVLNAGLDRLGPIFVQVYGQSEAPVTVTCLHKRDHADGAQRTSVGRSFRSVHVEVRDAEGRPLPPMELGEVAVTGSHLMSHYHGRPAETSRILQGGWIMTRDMGMMDERGFVYLHGRRDEIINSGGFNISPREVEHVLAAFQGVAEVVVIGMPDERWGEAVHALIRLNKGASSTPQEILDFAHPRLGFRTPKAVTFVDAIPRNAYGKLDRRQAILTLTGRANKTDDG